jgi:WD40 repeat protein
MTINRSCKLTFLTYAVIGLILSNTVATYTSANNPNALDKEKNKMAINNDHRQIIRLIDDKSTQGITAVAWSPDGKSVATAGDSTLITILDSASLSIQYQLAQGSKGHGSNHITFSPDSQYVASGLSIINVWDVAKGNIYKTLIAPHATPGIPQDVGIRGLSFSPDGKSLVVAYNGVKNIVVCFRLEDGNVIWSYEPQRTIWNPLITTSLAFTPDGKYVILGTGEGGGTNINLKHLSRVLFLDAETGKFLRSIDNVHMDYFYALALSREGKLVATATTTGSSHQTLNTDPVRIWDIETGKLNKELPVQSYVRAMAFSVDGKYLFGAKSDMHSHLTIAVWDVESGEMVQEVKSNPGPMGLAVSPDGKRLAAACQNKLSIYEIKTVK